MKTVANLYNPHEQSKDELIAGFVVRLNIFNKLFAVVKDSDMRYPEQHYLIEAQRGMGKTTLLLRLSYEIENDAGLNSWLLPLVFKEESYYGINRLFKLWEHCAQLLESKLLLFNGLSQQMQALPIENYERACFALLIEALASQQKKLLLLIDNIGEMFVNFNQQESQRLREVLMTCPQIRLFGASSITLESYFHYKHPFYEFFKKVSLPNLTQQETRDLLLQLATDSDEKQAIEAIINHQVGRVESLRILTGGVVRSIVLLFELFLDDNNGDSIKDLEGVLDRVTPLYQHRMHDLNPLQREIVDAIALQWDAMMPEDIALSSRYELKEVLAVLKELEKLFIIQRVATETSINYYQLQERFFNIWYLMRNAHQSSQAKVLWLVRFLQSWYDTDSLKLRAHRQIKALQQGDYHPKAAYYLAESIAATGQLDEDTQDQLLQKTRAFLAEKDQALMQALSVSDKELFQQAEAFYFDKNYQQVITLLLQIKQKNEIIYFYLGYIYEKIKNYSEAEHYYLIPKEKANASAMFNLALLYENKKQDDEQAEHYYLMAVGKGHPSAMFNLALLYKNKKQDYERAEHYCLMAVEEGHIDAMFNLALLYENQKQDYEQAEYYYLMAAKKGHASAIFNLAWLYENKKKDDEQAEYYYLMAVERGDVKAMVRLALLYENQKQDYMQAERYYLMAVKKGYAVAMICLSWLYFRQQKQQQQAINLVEQAVIKDKEKTYILSCVYLWANQFTKASEQATFFLHEEEYYQEFGQDIIFYLMLLLAKQQYVSVTDYFNTPDKNYQERFKPLYYALLKLTEDPAYQKHPPEIAEPIADILKEIKQLQQDYKFSHKIKN